MALIDEANRLLDCLCEQLAANPNPPAECCLRVGGPVIHDVDGQISSDKVCCPGLGYVQIGSKYPSSNFPAPDQEPAKRNNCMPVAFAAELTFGVIRCVPGMGTPQGPTCDDWTAAATQDALDLEAMGRALCCFGEGLRPGGLWLAGTSTVQLTADCLERQWPLVISTGKCC